MSAPNITNAGYAAIGVFTGAVGTFANQRGFSQTVLKNGVGDFTFTLVDSYDFSAGRHAITANPYSPLLATVSTEPVGPSPTNQIRVRCATLTTAPAVAAADFTFMLAVIPIGNP